MVFKRRDQLSWGKWLREKLYPKKGWRRAAEYVWHRLRRLPDTPHNIALGIACGVFVSFSPLFGLHFLYAALLAFVLRANVLASLLGTFFGNPFTFPVIAMTSYPIGNWVLGKSQPGMIGLKSLKNDFWSGVSGLWDSLLSIVGLGQARWSDVGDFFTDVFWPYCVGGLGPGILSSVIVYFIAKPIVTAYQNRRRGRLVKLAEIRKRNRHKRAADATK